MKRRLSSEAKITLIQLFTLCVLAFVAYLAVEPSGERLACDFPEKWNGANIVRTVEQNGRKCATYDGAGCSYRVCLASSYNECVWLEESVECVHGAGVPPQGDEWGIEVQQGGEK
jgi:hypothetical protein